MGEEGRKGGENCMTRVLVCCDDFWHPAEIIRKGLSFLESRGYSTDYVIDAKDTLTPSLLRQYPLIIVAKANQIASYNTNPWFEQDVSEVMPQDLEAWVRQGGGYLSLHAGNSIREDDPFHEFVGNYFVRHPHRCDVQHRVTADHPVTRDVEDFTLRDEHYEVVVTAEDARVLMRSRSQEGGDQVSAYIREMGKGRLCALMQGHILQNYEHPAFRKLILNALDWLARVS